MLGSPASHFQAYIQTGFLDLTNTLQIHFPYITQSIPKEIAIIHGETEVDLEAGSWASLQFAAPDLGICVWSKNCSPVCASIHKQMRANIREKDLHAIDRVSYPGSNDALPLALAPLLRSAVFGLFADAPAGAARHTHPAAISHAGGTGATES